MVNNILEYYYPLTFPSIKKNPKKTFYFRFSQWCYHLKKILNQPSLKGVSSSVVHKKGGFLGFFINMKTARETNDLLRIFEHIFIQQ